LFLSLQQELRVFWDCSFSGHIDSLINARHA